MQNFGAVFFVITLLILPSGAWTEEGIVGRIEEMKDTIYEDYRNFYAVENLEYLAIGIGIAGVLANTSIDGEAQGWDQGSLSKTSLNISVDNSNTIVVTNNICQD